MERVKEAARTVALAVLICAMLTTLAMATGSGNVWLKTADTSDGKGVTALIVTDTTVTDGVVELTYDSAKLTYGGIAVDEAYVAMYSVNADEAGVVKISWVAPGAFGTDGSAVGLIRVDFTGKGGEKVTLSGSARDAEGQEVPLCDAPDTSALEKAITEAEKRKPSQYTRESYAAVEKALTEAKAVLDDPCATQAEIDDAAKALNDAVAALVRLSGNTDTGDTAAIGIYVCLIAASVVCLAVLLFVYRRRRAR